MTMPQKTSLARRWLTVANALWFAAYLAVIGSVVGGLMAARTSALTQFQSADAQAEWAKFRAEMERQAQDPERSVTRRPPLGDEPPTLRLLRDYFAQILIIALLLTSALFGTLMYLIRGVMAGAAREVTSKSS